MSVQTVARIAALLALDPEMLRDFLPDLHEDEDNEENRAKLVHFYRYQLVGGTTEDEEETTLEEGTVDERNLFLDGDLNEIFLYVARNLERPVNGGDIGGGG